MGQPYPEGKNGVSLWDVEDIERRQMKERQAFERLMQEDSDPWVQRQLEASKGADVEADADLADEFDLEFGTGTDMAMALDQQAA